MIKKILIIIITCALVHGCKNEIPPTDKQVERLAPSNQENKAELTQGVKMLAPLYDANLTKARPSAGTQASFNPPALLWPGHKGAKYFYRIELSQDPTFSPNNTLQSEAKPWCMYKHHQSLEKGKWFWRYQHQVNNEWRDWSVTQSFIITDKSQLMPAASFTDFLNHVPKTHPRISLAGKPLEQFRTQALKHAYSPRLIEAANKSLPTKDNIKLMRQAYYLSGDQKFALVGAELFKSALEAYTPGHRFLSVRKMGTLATLYDAFYHHLEQDTHKMFKDKAMQVLNSHSRLMAHLELRGFDNHFWQMSMYGYLRIAMVMAHDHPEAQLHLEYAYNLALAKFPIVGPSDGGWANGHGYFHVNDVTLNGVPKDLLVGGIDLYKNHPWFKKTAKYLTYNLGMGATVPGFGDKSEKRTSNMYSFEMNLLFNQIKNNPLAAWTLRQERKRNSRAEFSDWAYICNDIVREDWSKAEKPEVLPGAAVFRGVGLAALHSDINKPKNNTVVYLHSSPYGGGIAHMTSSQNCFNISYKGQNLFYHTGNYKAGFSSPHIFTDYRHTRSHNGLLVNGLSQGIGMNYFGWIKHFANNDQIAYACGDASQAYGKIDENAAKHKRGKYGYGYLDTPLTKYDRHVALIRPNILVIYDLIEAKEDCDFSLVFNSRSQECQLSEKGIFTVENSKGRGVLQVFSQQDLKHEFSNKYLTPYKDEKPSRARFDSSKKTKKMRFLTIIQMGDKSAPPAKPLVIKNGIIETMGYTIKAQLDTALPAELTIKNAEASLKILANKGPTLSGTENTIKSIQTAPYLKAIY